MNGDGTKDRDRDRERREREEARQLPDRDPQRFPLPRWGIEYRDIWTDLLQDYSGAMVAALVGEDTIEQGDNSTMFRTLPSQEQIEEAVRLAALAADRALQEMQYREFIQTRRPRTQSRRR